MDEDLITRGSVIPISRGVQPRRAPMRPTDDSRLFGSAAWERRQEAMADARSQRYSRERHIKRAYRNLHLMEDMLTRLTAKGHTETGYEYSPLATLIFDLRMGIDTMPSGPQRHCWRVCVVGECKQIQRDGTWVTIRVPKMTHTEAADFLDMGATANVTSAIARATVYLEAFLFG